MDISILKRIAEADITNAKDGQNVIGGLLIELLDGAITPGPVQKECRDKLKQLLRLVSAQYANTVDKELNTNKDYLNLTPKQVAQYHAYTGMFNIFYLMGVFGNEGARTTDSGEECTCAACQKNKEMLEEKLGGKVQ